LKNISLLIDGDYPDGNKKNARIKAYHNGLVNFGWNCKIILISPTRFQREEKTKLDDVIYLTGDFRYRNNRIARYYQLIHGIFNSLVYITKLKKGEYVYFYNPTFFSSIYALILARIRGVKIVVDQTEIYSLNRYRFLNKIAEYISARMANIILAISINIDQHFKNLGAKQIFRFPIMVDVERFNIDVKPNKQLIGYIGSFGPKDGIDFMLRGFKQAQIKIPNLKLRLIGYNLEFIDLKKVIAEYDLENSVELTGKVEYEDIPRLLMECDTLIMNRTSSRYASFGYPIKLGEYFACKRPVLMSSGVGFSKDYEHLNEAIKYKIDDLKSFSEAILWRFNNNEKSTAIADNGYNYSCQNFDSFNQVKKLTTILENL
jgi:glycosyltransferase involved in cell wall biosynthesis